MKKEIYNLYLMFNVVVKESVENKKIVNDIQSGSRICPQRARIGNQQDQSTHICKELPDWGEREDGRCKGSPVVEFLHWVFV